MKAISKCILCLSMFRGQGNLKHCITQPSYLFSTFPSFSLNTGCTYFTLIAKHVVNVYNGISDSVRVRVIELGLEKPPTFSEPRLMYMSIYWRNALGALINLSCGLPLVPLSCLRRLHGTMLVHQDKRI